MKTETKEKASSEVKHSKGFELWQKERGIERRSREFKRFAKESNQFDVDAVAMIVCIVWVIVLIGFLMQPGGVL